jgi:Zinc carboxypeptidase
MTRRASSRPAALLAVSTAVLSAWLCAAPARAQDPLRDAQGVARIWDAEHIDYGPPQLLDHARLMVRLDEVVKEGAGLFTMERIGESVEGRSLNHVWFGTGPMHVLLWSQMHGDEPTATSALLDIMHILARHRAEAPVQRLLRQLTIHLVPMLNPDGAQRFQRRNAQGIDINRDALLLQAPEGRALKALRDRLQPSLGFNLHNQNWRTSAGKAKPATISLLAVAFDEARTETPGRLLAKRTCAVIRQSVEALAPGQVARYDDEFEVRAFGDNVTKWGTPVVLIETGPYAGPAADQALIKLNVVAILTALDALATGAAQAADARLYESLPMNESNLYTVVIRHASIVPGTGVAPFTGDLALGSTRLVTPADARGVRQAIQALRVDDLGDMRVFSALDDVDATGLFAVTNQGWKEGDTVPIADWTRFTSARPLAVGSAADIALLRPDAAGRYTVVRIVRTERLLGTS